MTYRKFKADHLFTGHEMLGGDSVLVTNEEGVVEEILPLDRSGADIEQFRGILTPGFINCHCHLELSHLKGLIPEGTGLVGFLLAMIRQRAAAGLQGVQEAKTGTQATEPQTLAERIQTALAKAEDEMLNNGIVAVGDICNTRDSLSQKKEGRLYYHNFIEAIGFTEIAAAGRFEDSRQIFNAFAEIYALPIAANSITPHAPYSVSSGLFGLIANFPGNQLLTIHNQESEAENEFYLTGKGEFSALYEELGINTSFFKGTGKRSLESYLPHFYPNQSLILVHNVATKEEDLRFVLGRQEKGAALFFCLCPNANLYISGQLPDPELLLRNDCRIVLGTDSLASNHRLSLLEELKTLQRHFPALSTTALLQWATINGAQALQLDGVLGSFIPGKQPGVLLIEGMEDGRFGADSGVRRLL